MKICVVGAGYVGLTTATALADFGHEVRCVDIEPTRIEVLNQGEVPFYEPGLKELIDKNLKKGSLHFSDQVAASIRDYPIILIAVGTPSQEDGSSNLDFLEDCLSIIMTNLTDYKLIITKSTVPLGTNERIHQLFINHGLSEKLFDIVSNPEFLREGTAIWDIYHPNKIVFGTKSDRPHRVLKKLYKRAGAPYIFTNLTGAELIKYASNAFLAVKISFANEMARICDAYHVDYSDLVKGLATDPRIGPYFLNAGLGFGGSCLPKDLKALKHSAQKANVATRLLDAVMEINDSQIEFCLNKLRTVLQDPLKRQVTVWGVTFKPGTDDLRSSPALRLIQQLLQAGYQIQVYDPMVKLELPTICSYADQYESVNGVEALIIATEWEQFSACDWQEVKSRMKGTIILDTRNCIDAKSVRSLGFIYLGVGKP